MKHKEFIDQMTLKEKAESTVMYQGRCFVTERLHNNGFLIYDNPRGNEDYQVEDSFTRAEGEYYPVAWPQAAAAAAAWDESVSFEIGAAMGRECKKHDVNVLLRPGVNIKRSPLCGRNFEYYSEDPVLAGKLGGAFIRGTQSQKTAACLKHYAVNSQEFERMTTNAVVGKRALRELYLKAFAIAVKEGKPWTVMTSYNKVNGHWVPANEELMKNLREDFGFDGAVLSDAMAVQTEKVDSHRYGLDFEIGQRGLHTRELQDAIERGILPESVLDQNIDNLLTLQDRTQAGAAYEGEIPENQAELDHARARELAAQTLVLLKNEGALPLQKGKKLAVIGRLAKNPNYMGCGSGHMNGWKVESTLDELQKLVGEEILYADGYQMCDRPAKEKGVDEALVSEAMNVAEQADVVIFFSGLPIGYESEGYDRTTLGLPADMQAMMDAVLSLEKEVVVVNVSGAPVTLNAAKEKAAAILHGYPAGESLGGAIADVLTGNAEPGGRLPETFPVRLEDTPAFGSFPSYPAVMPNVFYGEDIYVGYRWYEKRDIPVLYPFGYGLSYTEFSYSDLKLDRGSYRLADQVLVSLKVKNVGERDGSTVIQVYAAKEDSCFDRPKKELKAFARVSLKAGEEKEVVLPLSCEELGVYDEVHDRFVRESGAWKLIVAKDSQRTIGCLTFELEDGENAQIYHQQLALEWFLKHPDMAEILKDKSEAAQKVLGAGDSTMTDLICALPAYRMTEDSLFGPGGLKPEELSEILDELNRK